MLARITRQAGQKPLAADSILLVFAITSLFLGAATALWVVLEHQEYRLSRRLSEIDERLIELEQQRSELQLAAVAAGSQAPRWLNADLETEIGRLQAEHDSLPDPMPASERAVRNFSVMAGALAIAGGALALLAVHCRRRRLNAIRKAIETADE
jgi:hypothetical protein